MEAKHVRKCLSIHSIINLHRGLVAAHVGSTAMAVKRFQHLRYGIMTSLVALRNSAYIIFPISAFAISMCE